MGQVDIRCGYRPLGNACAPSPLHVTTGFAAFNAALSCSHVGLPCPFTPDSPQVLTPKDAKARPPLPVLRTMARMLMVATRQVKGRKVGLAVPAEAAAVAAPAVPAAQAATPPSAAAAATGATVRDAPLPHAMPGGTVFGGTGGCAAHAPPVACAARAGGEGPPPRDPSAGHSGVSASGVAAADADAARVAPTWALKLQASVLGAQSGVLLGQRVRLDQASPQPPHGCAGGARVEGGGAAWGSGPRAPVLLGQMGQAGLLVQLGQGPEDAGV